MSKASCAQSLPQNNMTGDNNASARPLSLLIISLSFLNNSPCFIASPEPLPTDKTAGNSGVTCWEVRWEPYLPALHFQPKDQHITDSNAILLARKWITQEHIPRACNIIE